MVRLYDAKTAAPVGEISESQLQFLVDHLEETSTDDQDYWIDVPTLAMLGSEGADEELVELLAGGIRGRPGYEVRWER